MISDANNLCIRIYFLMFKGTLLFSVCASNKFVNEKIQVLRQPF